MYKNRIEQVLDRPRKLFQTELDLIKSRISTMSLIAVAAMAAFCEEHSVICKI